MTAGILVVAPAVAGIGYLVHGQSQVAAVALILLSAGLIAAVVLYLRRPVGTPGRIRRSRSHRP